MIKDHSENYKKKYFPSRCCIYIIILFTLPLFIQLISSFIYLYLLWIMFLFDSSFVSLLWSKYTEGLELVLDGAQWPDH